MTTSEVAVRDQHDMPAKIQYAKLLAESGLLPASYRKQPANILYAVEYGELLGLPAMAAITGIHVIDGKPSVSAGLISALVRRAGHRLRVTGDDTSATCQITRADDPGFTYSVTWDMDRAKAAGLLGKTNWRTYPQAMLKARAVSEAARDACQEVLLGIQYTADELGGDDDGGEIVHDGFPTRPSGVVDGSQMTEEAKEAAGLMTRPQRVEHENLRRLGEPAAGAVEKLTEPDPADIWVQPAEAAAPPGEPRTASKGAVERLAKELVKFPLGPDEDVAVFVAWITGVEVPPEELTVGQVKLVTSTLDDSLKAAKGDFDLAASYLWQQYRRATGQLDGLPPVPAP